MTLKERALKEAILEEVFDTYWPKFDRRFQEILKLAPDAHEGEARPENEILQEILASTRSLERRMRSLESGGETIEVKLNPDKEVNSLGRGHIIDASPTGILRKIRNKNLEHIVDGLMRELKDRDKVISALVSRGLAEDDAASICSSWERKENYQ